jgi:two-component system, NtrC family, sensor kinase
VVTRRICYARPTLRSSPLRTLTGRIALGFFVLLATFGVVSGYTIVRMQQLGADLQFVRTAYSEVSLAVAQLSTIQGGMVSQIDGPVQLQPAYVRNSQKYRLRVLDDILSQLEKAKADAAPRERIKLAEIQARLGGILDEYKRAEPLLDTAFSPRAAQEAKDAALAQLSLHEKHLLTELNSWFRSLKSETSRFTLALEDIERQAALAAIVLGGVGALLGLLVTVWTLLSLRPLRRLHDGVRSVAAGNYRQRVSVTGATEVANLAREFNAMAAAIQEREQEVVRAERLAAVGKMAAVITHEVRNPLSSIGLNAELLEEELRASGSKEAVGLCGAIVREVDRLTAITEEYLRFARLPRPRLEREQINNIVAGVVEFQREDLAMRGVKVEAELTDLLPAIAADEAQLRQALLNLMRNAADAMRGGGALTVATRRSDDGAVEVEVRDTGAGIPSEHLPRIFEPFFSTKDGGTGLGLALTQQIVAEHGGRIDVASSPGRGTTFTLRLPAAA